MVQVIVVGAIALAMVQYIAGKSPCDSQVGKHERNHLREHNVEPPKYDKNHRQMHNDDEPPKYDEKHRMMYNEKQSDQKQDTCKIRDVWYILPPTEQSGGIVKLKAKVYANGKHGYEDGFSELSDIEDNSFMNKDKWLSRCGCESKRAIQFKEFFKARKPIEYKISDEEVFQRFLTNANYIIRTLLPNWENGISKDRSHIKDSIFRVGRSLKEIRIKTLKTGDPYYEKICNSCHKIYDAVMVLNQYDRFQHPRKDAVWWAKFKKFFGIGKSK